ncbi:MAG: MBG domain-containing protein, partial [Candidatus Limnocylindrales bacterium]
ANGTCTIAANQAGNGVYSAAPQVTQNVSVGLNPQTITFDTPAPSGTVGQSGVSVHAVATSGLPVTYSSLTPSICTVNGSSGALTLLANGTCTIAANQAGNANGTCTIAANQAGNGVYSAAPQVTQNVSVGLNPQTITFDTLADKVYGDGTITLSASASSSLLVTFAVSGSCSISGNVVTITGVGTCTVKASQAGDANWAPAADVVQSFDIGPAPLTITANNQTRPYHTANPAFTSAISGFVYGETQSVMTALPTCDTTADINSGVGAYAITCDGASAANYSIHYVNGTLTVTPPTAKPVLVVTADSLSKNAGDPNPTLTYTISGWVDGDTEASLTTPPTCTTTADASSLAGTYPITCAGAASDKYAITYTPGVLTVVGSQVGGESQKPVRSPTPPVTSTSSDSPLSNSVPLIGLLICLAFGGLGLLAVRAQRRTMRPR